MSVLAQHNNVLEAKQTTIQSVVWWACFLFSTYALSRVFEASRALTGSLPEASWLELSTWMLALLATFMYLALTSYRKERAKGTILKPKALMEFLDQCIPFGRLQSVNNSLSASHDVKRKS